MLPNSHTLVSQTNFTIKIALGKKPGVEYVTPFIAASGDTHAQSSQVSGPDYWMEMTESFCAWAIAIILNAMRVQTNVAVCDGNIMPIGGSTVQAWATATLARPATLGEEPLANWQIYARLPNSLDDLTDDFMAGINLNPDDQWAPPMVRCNFGASQTGAGFGATGHLAGASRLLIAINALAQLARCCPVGTAGMDALSVSFMPSADSNGHVTHWALLLASVDGERAGVVEYVSPQALFIRLVSAIVDRFAFPATERSAPVKLRLDLAQNGFALRDVEVAVDNRTGEHPDSEWVAGSVEVPYDDSYLNRFKSSGVFMSSAFAPRTTEQSVTYHTMSLWPVPLSGDLSLADLPFHNWYHPDGGTGRGWAAVFGRIEASPVIPLLPLMVDYDSPVYATLQSVADARDAIITAIPGTPDLSGVASVEQLGAVSQSLAEIQNSMVNGDTYAANEMLHSSAESEILESVRDFKTHYIKHFEQLRKEN